MLTRPVALQPRAVPPATSRLALLRLMATGRTMVRLLVMPPLLMRLMPVWDPVVWDPVVRDPVVPDPLVRDPLVWDSAVPDPVVQARVVMGRPVLGQTLLGRVVLGRVVLGRVVLGRVVQIIVVGFVVVGGCGVRMGTGAFVCGVGGLLLVGGGLGGSRIRRTAFSLRSQPALSSYSC
ncbi:hypothetical protein GCM10010530_13920 [Kribbella aluminosa]